MVFESHEAAAPMLVTVTSKEQAAQRSIYFPLCVNTVRVHVGMDYHLSERVRRKQLMIVDS